MVLRTGGGRKPLMVRALGDNFNTKTNFGFSLAEGTTHAGIFSKKCQFGFTLAEVLITLGIIGVVAAITLPSVINHYKKKVLSEQFKKSYATLANAYEKAKADLGYANECYYDYDYHLVNESDCKELNKNIENNLKIVKTCINNAVQNGCISDEMKGINKIKLPTGSDIKISNYGLFNENYIKNYDYVFVISDGTTVVHYQRNVRALYLVDINGKKGPNMWGYDIYALSTQDGKLMCHRALNNAYEPGGHSCSDMFAGIK